MFFFIPKRDYSTIPSIEEGNVQNEPERMFAGAAVIMSCALFWREEKRAEACGVMSCITASVHNPSHLMSFGEHSLFNTVRSISRWRKGWGDVEPFVQTDTVWGGTVLFKGIYLSRRFLMFTMSNCALLFAQRNRQNQNYCGETCRWNQTQRTWQPCGGIGSC